MSPKRIIVLIFLMCFVIACHTNVTKAGKTTGQADPQTRENTSGPLALSFSKSSYSVTDTITLSLLNKSDSDIAIALRCGHYLEMSYQKYVNGNWSENKELSYMMLKCPTRINTIRTKEKYTCNVPSSLFNSTGKFRLLVSFTVGTENNNQTITSVPFEIR